jgi:hypothetical protein
MSILGIAGERPIVLVKSELGANWLGKDKWSEKNPLTSTITLQRSILHDPRTLERVVAHEMVHHRDFLAMTPADIAFARVVKHDGHGAAFLEGAERVNAIMGPNFVTVHSDKEYVHAPHTKEFYVLIAPAHRGRLGWAWAGRLSPEAQAIVAEKEREGAKLVRTTDLRWTAGKAKIKKYGGLSMPPAGSELETALHALYGS